MAASLSRRERITRTAIEIIDELGILGLSIREIAKRQEVTEPAIYRHFTGKQEIILSGLGKVSDLSQATVHEISRPSLTGLKAIIYFVKSQARFFQDYPPITSVIFAEEIFRDDPVVLAAMREVFERRAEVIETMVKQAQQEVEMPRS
ncbi:MAG: TetR/AcrR family transcriptional regulator [Bacillota bacterium]